MTQQQQQQQVPLPREKEEALARLVADTGCRISMDNGQRRFGGEEGDPPARGSEVFVGKLPRDAFEDEIVPFFQKVGTVREVRLMMDPSGTAANRGYCFVVYSSPVDARRAVEQLNGRDLRPGRPLGVCKSVDNCRLFVGGVPRSRRREEIEAEMRACTEGVRRVILYASVADKAKNRGFAFVEYESHRAAAAARRRLIQGRAQLFGHDVAVDWAEPEPEVDEHIMAKVTVLYVRNLMMETSEEKLRSLFSLEGSLKVEKVKKLRDFAFVHFRSREDAEEALDRLNETDIDGSTVEVTWAKPADKVTRMRGLHPRMPPFLYGGPPSFVPFPAPPGRGGLVARMRGRSRGAAGIRRFRNYAQNSVPPFKQQDGQTRHLRMADSKGDAYEPGYYGYLMPAVPHTAEGLDPGLPHLQHRIPPAYFYHTAGFDEVSYYYVPPGHAF